MNSESQNLVVHQVKREASSILSFEFRHPGGASLSAFSAGAHVDVELPNGLIRSYSLVNPQSESHRYVIAVSRDAESRGGSRFMHDHVRPGDLLPVSLPRNHFPLHEEASRSIFVAGGIGITPIICMIQRVNALRLPWGLFYFARSRESAAFVDRIEELAKAGYGQARLIVDEGRAGRALDLAQIVSDAGAESHFYCCGPAGMLERFEEVTAGLPPQQVHREYFSARAPALSDDGFVVELAKSRQTLAVPPGKTILETLLDAGVQVPYSCSQGVCGACETRVLEGIPKHRDFVLTLEEQASRRTMMICCSGSSSQKLVLDI